VSRAFCHAHAILHTSSSARGISSPLFPLLLCRSSPVTTSRIHIVHRSPRGGEVPYVSIFTSSVLCKPFFLLLLYVTLDAFSHRAASGSAGPSPGNRWPHCPPSHARVFLAKIELFLSTRCQFGYLSGGSLLDDILPLCCFAEGSFSPFGKTTVFERLGRSLFPSFCGPPGMWSVSFDLFSS